MPSFRRNTWTATWWSTFSNTGSRRVWGGRGRTRDLYKFSCCSSSNQPEITSAHRGQEDSLTMDPRKRLQAPPARCTPLKMLAVGEGRQEHSLLSSKQMWFLVRQSVATDSLEHPYCVLMSAKATDKLSHSGTNVHVNIIKMGADSSQCVHASFLMS